MRFDDYLESVTQTLTTAGFTEHPADPDVPGAGSAWHKREFQITKFGMVDTFVIPGRLGGQSVLQRDIEEFCSACFEFSTSHKFFLPRGLFSTLVVHPLLVVDSVGPGTRDFIVEEYNPKHWSATEFPALYELSSGELYRYAETPIWGAAYYSGLRDSVDHWFSPAGELPA